MRTAQQLPAKVIKRVGQVRRLGARGLFRTAYVRTLGPSVYALTDPARVLGARLHRQKSLSRELPQRLGRLKLRAVNELHRDGATDETTEFGENLGRFVQTLEAMFDLAAAGCSVPRVTAVDWERLAITTEQVRSTISCAGPNELEQALLAIHRAGYVLGKIDDGTVALSGDDGAPVYVDLSHALPLAGVSRDLSIHLRDADRHALNLCFGTRLLTASRLRALLSPTAGIPHDEVDGLSQVYAPVILRDDIRWGKIWNTDVGVGRWNFIMKQHLPIPVGGSVLDLGSNNGFNPLQMLRAGAASAVGVEISKPELEQSEFLKSAYEWLDNLSYDFRCIRGSQRDLPSFGLGRFDLVTAFCSLYYLPDAEIRELVGYIRTLTDTFVVQCNIDRLIDRRGEEETYRKASVEYAIEVLEEAGFTNRTIVAPPGYSRPLVIARAA